MVPVARSRARSALLGALVLLAGLCLSCAAIEHGLQTKDYAGRPLSPRSAQGAKRFQTELAIDPTLRDHVARKGRPDFFYVVDRQRLYVFYIAPDDATLFERVLIEPSRAKELGRIPGSLLKLLPPKARRHVEAQRKLKQRRAQSKARRAKEQIARSRPRLSPAAQAPGGTYIGGFEVDEIVARMRPPLTAADPGIDGWSRSRLRNGHMAYSAKVGRTSYEVRLDRVAFTVHMGASTSRLPNAARLAMQRVNNAIFGAKSNAVTQQMLELAKRAAADRSGRTAFHQRVAGRTIRIGRRLDQSVLAYSIHP